MKVKMVGVAKRLNKHDLAIERLLSQFKQLVVVDKRLSLYKLCEEGNALKVDERFFSSFGVQTSDLRYLEYFLFNQEQQSYLYYGSWKWTNERLLSRSYDHVGIFTTNSRSLSIEHFFFTGIDSTGKKSATYDSCTRKKTGNIHVSTLPWYTRERVGFWIDTKSISSGSILATIRVDGQTNDKIHMQYDRNQHGYITTGLEDFSEKKTIGFSIKCNNEFTSHNSIYSEGVGK